MEPVELNTPEYTVELWDINGVFVADVTALASNLKIVMPLNDVEDVSFSLDLVQFEELCASIGARPVNIIEPYRTDVKIRRNGNYLVGAHVVQTTVNFDGDGINTIDVQCTGYLNHLKDRFLTMRYKNYSYAQIAQQVIIDTQSAYNLITNGDFFEGLDGWQYWESGYVVWDSITGNTDNGSLYVSVSTGPNTYGAARYNVSLQAGLEYTLTYYIKPVTGTASTYIKAGAGSAMNTTAITDTVNFTQVSHTWTQPTDESSINIYMDTSTNFWIDDVKLSDNVDNSTIRDFGITIGVDEATPTGQQTDRVRTYDLQNVKDAIINLSKLEEDQFDFAFDANKVFNIWDRKGSDKAQVELVYPQNIKTLKATRSTAKLANKVFGLGSGIGNERLETSVLDYPSGLTYRVRERTEMFNSVELITTLIENSLGALDEYKDIDDNIDITVVAGELDLDEVETGDAIYIRVDNSTYVDYVNGLYRIVKMSIDVSQEFDETVSLELEKWD